MRTKGAALATASDWLGNYIVVQTTPPGIHHLKWGLYLIYALLNVAFVPLIRYFLVETKGRSMFLIFLPPNDRTYQADQNAQASKTPIAGSRTTRAGWFIKQITPRVTRQVSLGQLKTGSSLTR